MGARNLARQSSPLDTAGQRSADTALTLAVIEPAQISTAFLAEEVAVDYRVLGPLDVWADDVPLSLGGRKQAADYALSSA
jgi:hypothetical protein